MNSFHLLASTPFSPYADLAANARHRPEPVYCDEADYVSLYARVNEDYTNNRMTPYTVQFLKRMAESSARNFLLVKIVAQYFKSDLFTQLLYVCKLLHMNEVEIVVWSLEIESAKTDWVKSAADQPVVFLIAGFQAKVWLAHAVEVL